MGAGGHCRYRVISLALVAFLSSWCGVAGRNLVLSESEARWRPSSLRAGGRQVPLLRTGEDSEFGTLVPTGLCVAGSGQLGGRRAAATLPADPDLTMAPLDMRVCPVYSRVWLSVQGECVLHVGRVSVSLWPWQGCGCLHLGCNMFLSGSGLMPAYVCRCSKCACMCERCVPHACICRLVSGVHLYVCETHGHMASRVAVHVCPGRGHLSCRWVGAQAQRGGAAPASPQRRPHTRWRGARAV